LILSCLLHVKAAEDYYKLLGVKKNADNREIRKAFKKLALILHPDKNDAEDANEKFLKVNRAYEVLKDEELRKKYDMTGEDPEEGGSNKYQSWQYYNTDFGIYDDDEEIVTLDWREFQESVLHGHSLWFVNYYSPRCGHCHELAPAWRKLARELEGTGIRIAAVNCQEEFGLCRSQGIQGYPSLMLYTMNEGTKKFQGSREEEHMLEYLVRFVQDQVVTLWEGNMARWAKKGDHGAWLVILCVTDSCIESTDRKLLGASLEGVVTVGVVECKKDPKVCKNLREGLEEEGDSDMVIFHPQSLDSKEGRVVLTSSLYNRKEVVDEVLSLLPKLTNIDAAGLDELRRRLDQDVGPAWLIMFSHPEEGGISTEYKKLVPALPRMRVGTVDCQVEHKLCYELYIVKYPTFILFKVGGAMEVHYGKPGLQEVANFGRLSSQARTMETLLPSDFPEILGNSGVFVDFFAPWCPPCMSLLPEFRKASTFIGGSITFGTIDCTIHGRLCQQHGVRAYPTTIFFNQTKPHRFQGEHRARALADFVEDTLRPAVITLTGKTFHQMVGTKSAEEIWLVDFFAPWCGPCQELAVEWRQLAKDTRAMPMVRVAKVDCTVEQNLCYQMGINGYPTIRMYPLGSKGSSRYQPYPNRDRGAESLLRWVQEQIPSTVENLTPFSIKHSMLGSPSLWLVDFFTPWCGHCKHFAPYYEQVALALKDKAKVGKVNCERYKQLCSQADVEAYPTVRIYLEATDLRDFEEVEQRSVEEILKLVEEKLGSDKEESIEEEEKPRNHDEL